MATVSVVIPCYNHGLYLDEAVQSVLEQTYSDFEIIIVNDGSTDSYTNNLINGYRHKKIRVVTTANRGLPSARNNGISKSKGKYILPLDADDRIGKDYLDKAVHILEHNENVGIVYCEAEFFGEEEGRLQIPEYSPELILINNIIFCSALFRKRLWQDVGGYNTNMKYGLEDWDLWLSIITLGCDVYKIPETLFFYRKNKCSMIDELVKDKAKVLIMNMQIIINHHALYLKNLEKLYLLLFQTINAAKGLSCLASLYIDLGRGFQEDLSVFAVSAVNQNKEFKLSFDLSNYKGISGMRFDPVEGQACMLKLKQIIIMQDNIRNILVFDDLKNMITHNGSINEAGEISFYNNDPHVYLPIKGNIENLRIEGELTIIENAEIFHQIEQKNQEIKQKTLEVDQKILEIEQKNYVIEQILSSTSWKITAPLRFIFKILKI